MSTSRSKFIQIVYVYPLTITYKEDYFTWPADMMKERGYVTELLTVAKTGKRTEVINGHTLKRFSSRFDHKYLPISAIKIWWYLLRQNAVVHAHLRPYPPSIAAAFLFNKKKVLTPFTYLLGNSWYMRRLSPFLMKRFNRVIPMTPYERDVYLRAGLPKSKVTFVPLAIDYHLFADQKPDLKVKKKYDLDGFTIATLANFRYVKRVDVLLMAFAEVKKEIPQAKLLIIGDDWLDQEKKPTITQMIADMKLKDVRHLGFVPAEEVARIFQFVDVLAATSELESQCLAVYEAGAASIPLALSRIGSFTSVFGENALYHDVEDYQQLAKNIIRYYNDRKLVKKNTSSVKQLVKEWDNAIVKEKLLRVYKDVLKFS